jgi:hypothetical protein
MADNKMDIGSDNNGVANNGNSNNINQNQTHINNHNNTSNIVIVAIVAIVALVLIMQNRPTTTKEDLSSFSSEAKALISKEEPKEVIVEKKVINPSKETIVHNHEHIITIDGIMYQNEPFSEMYTWKEAKIYCENLKLGNYSGWRLPTRQELHKLSNIKMYGDLDSNWEKWFKDNKHYRNKNSKGDQHFIVSQFIENMPSLSWFWTSETRNNDSAWVVRFYNGYAIWDLHSNSNYVLCVRGE